MKLNLLVNKIDFEDITGLKDCDVVGIASDSRNIRSGYIFIAITGKTHDGRAFIDDAVEKGAIAVVQEEGCNLRRDICNIIVKDTRLAVGEFAKVLNGNPSGKLETIGVTGTNGKTTTSYIIRDILRASGRNPGLIGTIVYEIGARVIPACRTTPEAPMLQSILAEMAGIGCKSVVMEVSSHALVQKRIAGIDYDVGVFTNLTRDHLDYHGNMEKYFEAKRLLFQGLGNGNKNATAVINMDSPWGMRLLKEGGINADIITYGMDSSAMISSEEVKQGPDGSSFILKTPWGSSKIKTMLLGRFNVSNALAAVAVCGSLEIDLDLITSVLLNAPVISGRLEEIRTKKGFQIFVDYAHTDDALANVLNAMRGITHKRLIVVFGCGGNRDNSKRIAMGKVADRMADYSIITSDNPRKENPADIVAEIREGFTDESRFKVIKDRREAIRYALDMADRGDIVLIAGKGHERFQEFGNTIIPFDDRKVVKECLCL